jgi:hypothetical protein
MLDVDGCEDIDPVITENLDILVALGSIGSLGIGVGEFVDQDNLRIAPDDRVYIELGDFQRTMPNCSPWNDLEITDLGFGIGPAMRLYVAYDDIVPFGAEAVALPQHGVGLSNTGRRAKQDAQIAPANPAVSGTGLVTHRSL